MSPATDPYREWDAAYVMGSLSPRERHEYEQHLTTCPSCSSDVAELAGIPGMLSAVPADQAMAMLVPEGAPGPAISSPVETPAVPPTLLPRFIDATRRTRTRTRTRARAMAWVAGGLTVAAAAVLVIAVAVGLIGSPTDDGRELTMSQTEPGPITAQASFTEQPWGTTIRLECSYATFYGGELLVRTGKYSLVVIDRAGNQTQQATWEAEPGSTVSPTTTTALPIDEIDRIQVRLISTGRVLLEVSPGP